MEAAALVEVVVLAAFVVVLAAFVVVLVVFVVIVVVAARSSTGAGEAITVAAAAKVRMVRKLFMLTFV